MRQTLNQSQSLADNALVAYDWKTLLPLVVQMVEMSQVNFYLILSVVFVVVGIGVMNTMVISVMERTPKLCAMLASGAREGQLQLTILFEAFFLALLGMAGLVLASNAEADFSHSGSLKNLSVGSRSLIDDIRYFSNVTRLRLEPRYRYQDWVVDAAYDLKLVAGRFLESPEFALLRDAPDPLNGFSCH